MPGYEEATCAAGCSRRGAAGCFRALPISPVTGVSPYAVQPAAGAGEAARRDASALRPQRGASPAPARLGNDRGAGAWDAGTWRGGPLVITQLSYRGRSAELLAQELPPLRFRFCYCSPSNLCANRVCPAHAVKYASLESSLAPSGCFTGGYVSYVYETRETPRVSELLAVFSLRALHPAAR